MKKKTAYSEWEERWKKELKFYSSKEGRELELCLVAQGYRERLMGRYMVLFGSGFVALEIIKNIEEEIRCQV